MTRTARCAGRPLLVVLAAAITALLGLAGACAWPPVSSSPRTSAPAPRPTPTSASPLPPGPAAFGSVADCPRPQSGFDCDFQRRFAAVDRYLANRPGMVAVVVHDRQTGAVWRNDDADTPIWTASTIKLAMAVDLFERDRAGAIQLSADDRDLIHAMLHNSDDNAADTLWFRYAGSDHMAFNRDFAQLGMTSLRPQRGFSDFYPYWGFQQCTANDLLRLIDHVLDDMPRGLRDHIVGELRTVAPDQQWGVWDAGPAAQPGNKDGWSLEQGGWVMNTVGFAGPAERYTVAVMNSLRGQGGYDEGRATDSHVAQLLFGGRF
ncbi:serine hydrolase [Gandjariella thermophila]|uniref:Tat pathway signal sequence n=1 Tax=Gandjariella thermophila TaxID=1931992 RepID=A0A4D4JEC1_9PSEU|nr:serine hydrolase [Gandjariella thermophila]GDY33762.1 hypothetical protein GTS_53950 [Gandjariella thermophila]